MKNKILIVALYAAVATFGTAACFLDSRDVLPPMMAMLASGGYIALFDVANSR